MRWNVSDMVARYRDGATIDAIAKQHTCSAWTVRDQLRRHGETLRRRGPKRTYTLNEEFFESIATEAQAYWLGFILADGRTSQTGAGNWVTRVDLGVIDRGHLVKLLDAVGSNAPVKPGHDGQSAYVDLCSVALCRQLLALECTPDKTGNHGTPVIPASLQHHFYRGYSDGDGSLFWMPQARSWRYEAVGSPRFVEQFQQWLITRAGVGETKLIRRPPVASLRYTGGTQIERICRVLYDNATICLDRKHEEYRRVLTRKRRWPRRAPANNR